MTKDKVVTVIKEVRMKFEVEAGGNDLTDDQAIETVKARLDAGSPLGFLHEEEEEKILKFEVTEKE